MDQAILINLLAEQIEVMNAAVNVLKESHERVGPVLGAKRDLSVGESESCEALTARFARLCDFLFQKIFRTIDRIELQDEGSPLDRINRMEKRGIIGDGNRWRELRNLRNSIAHDYLIEKSDTVLVDAYQSAQDLFETVNRTTAYIKAKKYIP